MNHMNSRFFQFVQHTFSEHGVVLQSFFHLFRRFFLSWTITRLRILAIWMVPLVFVFTINILLIIWLTGSTGGSIGWIIEFVSRHPIAASFYALFIVFLWIVSLYLFIFSSFLLVRACLSYAQKQRHIFVCRKYLTDWTLHKALWRFIVVSILGIAAYTVLAIFSTSLVVLGISGESLDFLSALLAIVGAMMLMGIWYSFAFHIMRYSKRTLWMVYFSYVSLLLLSFLIAALGFSDIALVNIVINNQLFLINLGEIPSTVIILWLSYLLLSLFLSYIWAMVLFARNIEKPLSTWFGVFQRSYDLSLGQRKKVFLIIIPFWIGLVLLTSCLDFLSNNSISYHSYSIISQELRDSHQWSVNDTQSGSQDQITDQDILGSYLIADAFSGTSFDRELHPKVLELFQKYEPQKESVNKELFMQISPIIDHQRVGTLHPKTKLDQFPFAYYSIVYFFVFLDWILLSGLLFYTIVNWYLFLKKNHVSSHIHE